MNNYNNNLQFLDLLNIASFCLGIMNLEQNLNQNDKQDLEEELNKNLHMVLDEIHNHLKEQDRKIDLIMEKLGVVDNDR